MNCSMAVGEGLKGFCWRCGIALPKYRRKWCSDDCALWYVRNHDWGNASDAALKRDGWKCVKCGAQPPKRRDGFRQLEVNHIRPRNGQGYGPGCWNHLTNLETLCHNCHVKVTTKQRQDRKGAFKIEPYPRPWNSAPQVGRQVQFV